MSRVGLDVIGRLALTTVMVFVVNSFVTVPLPRRGLAGHGLYTLVDEIQVLEVILVSAVVVYVVSVAVLRLTKSRAALATAGGVFVNTGLLIMDVRMHSYPATAEAIIAEKYGSPWFLWLAASALVIGGIIALLSASRRSVPSQDRKVSGDTMNG